jgi:hypothetical protein
MALRQHAKLERALAGARGEHRHPRDDPVEAAGEAR